VMSGAVLEKAWAFVCKGLTEAALLVAIKSGDLAEVQLYACVGVEVKMLKGYMPNDTDEEYEEEASPLYWAACYNQLEIVRYFVESGLDIEKGDSDGATPLFATAGEGHLEVVRYLVEQGANKNIQHGEENSLSTAATNGHLEVVRYLVEHGVDTIKDDRAFEFACYNGHADIAEYLLDVRCIDIDLADHFGRTALHYAARDGHLDVAQVLFRYGATLDIQDNDGDTPADIATAAGHDDIADAIRAEEIRRRDHGFKRDRSTIPGTEEHEASKRPRAEREAAEAAAAAAEAEAAADESDDDDDDEEDDEDEEG